MFKKQDGISIIMLVISIVVMLILISIVMNSSLNSIEEVDSVKIEDEIRNLREAVNDRMINYERNSILYPMVGRKIADDKIYLLVRSIDNKDSSEISRMISSINKNYSEETKNYYRIVGNSDAQSLGVSNIDPEHYYVVDYIEVEVYGPVSLELVQGLI